MIQECRHVMPSGLHCKSPAMRGSAFCYFHGRAPRPARPARASESRIDLPAVLDGAGTQKAIHQVIQALASGHITSRRAAVLLQGFQMAATQESSSPSGATQLAQLFFADADASRMPDHILVKLDTIYQELTFPAAPGETHPAKQ